MHECHFSVVAHEYQLLIKVFLFLKQLLLENAVIDHLLAETELQLEEVAKHVRGLATTKEKEQQDLEEQTRLLIGKMEAASRKIDETEQEQDLQLRKDLVNREFKVIEAEVKTILSRGDNMALLMKRKNPKDYDSLVDHLTDLRNVWKTMQVRILSIFAAIL